MKRERLELRTVDKVCIWSCVAFSTCLLAYAIWEMNRDRPRRLYTVEESVEFFTFSDWVLVTGVQRVEPRMTHLEGGDELRESHLRHHWDLKFEVKGTDSFEVAVLKPMFLISQAYKAPDIRQEAWREPIGSWRLGADSKPVELPTIESDYFYLEMVNLNPDYRGHWRLIRKVEGLSVERYLELNAKKN